MKELGLTTVEESWTKFNEKFYGIVEDIVPKQEQKRKMRQPLMNGEIMRQIRRK